MPELRVHGLRLHYESAGEGDAILLVHGSWSDHTSWDLVVPGLAREHRVVRYDRRGHSRSEAPPGQGSVRDDARDLLAIVEQLDLAPVLGVGNSFGAIVTLRAAAKRPEAFRGIMVHEPPLVRLLQGDAALQPVLAATQARFDAVLAELVKDHRSGAKLFMETIGMGPGSWATLPPRLQDAFTRNAPTWIDEMHDPEALTLDLPTLRAFDRPALLTQGSESAPFFAPILDRLQPELPKAERRVLQGMGHVPHVSHPKQWLPVALDFAARLA